MVVAVGGRGCGRPYYSSVASARGGLVGRERAYLYVRSGHERAYLPITPVGSLRQMSGGALEFRKLNSNAPTYAVLLMMIVLKSSDSDSLVSALRLITGPAGLRIP